MSDAIERKANVPRRDGSAVMARGSMTVAGIGPEYMAITR
jgi:hypothetical protein